MKRSNWMIIARNEYLLLTSGSPLMRKLLPFLIIGMIILFLVVLAPLFFDIIKNDLLVVILSQAGLSSVAITLLTLFFYLMIIPITNTLKEEQAYELEIFLAAPVEPQEVLLGKFMGKLIVYGTGAILIAGFFASAFTLLGISTIQTIIISVMVFLLMTAGIWIGTVVAAVLKTRLSKTAKGRDIGKALSMIIVLPLLAFLYALLSGVLYTALQNPSTAQFVERALSIFPTTWGAEVIVGYANAPGELLPADTMVMAAMIGILLFTIGSFVLGNWAVSRAYSLEPTSFISSKVKREGAMVKALRLIMGSGPFSVVLIGVVKDWGRRLENISKLGYILGLIFLLVIFISRPEEPFGVVMFLMLMLGLLAAFLVGEVTIRGKETLFLYRKAPGGEERLIKARLLQSWLVVVPTVLLLTLILLAFIPDLPPSDFVIYPLFMVQAGMSMSTFTLGLFLLKPAFTEKSGQFVINIMVAMLTFFLLILLAYSFLGTLGLVTVFIPISWVLAISLLSLGVRNLRRIE